MNSSTLFYPPKIFRGKRFMTSMTILLLTALIESILNAIVISRHAKKVKAMLVD
jgi:hypothetical protein